MYESRQLKYEFPAMSGNPFPATEVRVEKSNDDVVLDFAVRLRGQPSPTLIVILSAKSAGLLADRIDDLLKQHPPGEVKEFKPRRWDLFNWRKGRIHVGIPRRANVISISAVNSDVNILFGYIHATAANAYKEPSPPVRVTSQVDVAVSIALLRYLGNELRGGVSL